MPTPNPITGRRITAVRPMTSAELTDECWATNRRHANPVAIVLDDGTILYASSDEEGNGPGALFGRLANGEHIAIATAG